MRKKTILKDFSRYTDAELDQFTAAVVLAMTGNANFTTPAPTLAVVTAANTAFQLAMANALNGGEEETAIKDAKRTELEALLKPLALYVEIESAGDSTIMLSSGFKVSKDPTPVGNLPKPTGFEVVPEGKGEIRVKCDAIKGAKTYQFEYKLTTATEWTLDSGTASKVLITGLTSGKEYNFRVVPIGTSKIREYSDVVQSFVL